MLGDAHSATVTVSTVDAVSPAAGVTLLLEKDRVPPEYGVGPLLGYLP